MGTSEVLAQLPPGIADTVPPYQGHPALADHLVPPQPRLVSHSCWPTVSGTGTASPQETRRALHPKPASILLGVSLGLTQPRTTVAPPRDSYQLLRRLPKAPLTC